MKKIKICGICSKKIIGKSTILEISKEKDIRLCGDCLGHLLLMRVAKGEKYDHNLEGLVNELKEMKEMGLI